MSFVLLRNIVCHRKVFFQHPNKSGEIIMHGMMSVANVVVCLVVVNVYEVVVFF